jgi:hypothetical protein
VIRWLALAALTLGGIALSGCPLIYGDDDDSATGGLAPRIESSLPGPAVQQLVRGEEIVFSARGSDDDSLDLTWSFTLEQDFVAGGDVDDGLFDVAWTMEFDELLAGEAVQVRFAVSDGRLVTERLWAVELAP